MRKKLIICFSISVMIGAVVFFTGATHANAEQISNAWSGVWTCATTSSDGVTYDGGRNMSRQIIYTDGTTEVEHWLASKMSSGGYDIGTKGGNIYGTAFEGAYWIFTKYTLSFTDDFGVYHNEIYDYTCIGALHDAQYGFHQADCIIAVSVGYPTVGRVVIQRAQCKRMDREIE